MRIGKAEVRQQLARKESGILIGALHSTRVRNAAHDGRLNGFWILAEARNR